jgi:hypothetical protein
VNVLFGKNELELGGRYLTELRDSNDLLHDAEALRERMETDGYLLIRGFHERAAVLKARNSLLNVMSGNGRLAPGTPPEDGVIGPENKDSLFQGLNKDMPDLLELVNSERILNFFSSFLGGPALTYDFKWARAVSRGNFSGAHYDVVYMGRGTKQLYTAWTPLGDVSCQMGGLALCLGSREFESVKKTYGEMDVDRDNVFGWFSSDPTEVVDTFGGRWATTEYKAGDVLIFGMYMMHASLTNTTDRYRLSVDTRYQLASEPVDERWFGKNKGHYGHGHGGTFKEGETVPMEKAREKWGV